MTVTHTPEPTFPATMSQPLQVRIRSQGWAFSRQDALRFGATDVELRTWCASGAVNSCGHGAYFMTTGVGSDPYSTESAHRRIRAQLLALGGGYFATHQSAVVAWDLPAMTAADSEQVHVGHQGGRRWSRRAQVRLHRVRENVPICTTNEIPAVPAAYAIAQVGASAGVEAAVIAADTALQRGLANVAELAELSLRCGVHRAALAWST